MSEFFEDLRELQAEIRNEDDVPDHAFTAREYADSMDISYDKAKHELRKGEADGLLESGYKYALDARGHEQRLKHFWRPAE